MIVPLSILLIMQETQKQQQSCGLSALTWSKCRKIFENEVHVQANEPPVSDSEVYSYKFIRYNIIDLFAALFMCSVTAICKLAFFVGWVTNSEISMILLLITTGAFLIDSTQAP